MAFGVHTQWTGLRTVPMLNYQDLTQGFGLGALRQ